jgi:hypothetical protein
MPGVGDWYTYLVECTRGRNIGNDGKFDLGPEIFGDRAKGLFCFLIGSNCTNDSMSRLEEANENVSSYKAVCWKKINFTSKDLEETDRQ